MRTSVLLIPIELNNSVSIVTTPIEDVIEAWIEQGPFSTNDGPVFERKLPVIVEASLEEFEDWFAYETYPCDIGQYNIRFADRKDILIAKISRLVSGCGSVSVSDISGKGVVTPCVWKGNAISAVISRWGATECCVEIYHDGGDFLGEESQVFLDRLSEENLEQILKLTERYVESEIGIGYVELD